MIFALFYRFYLTISLKDLRNIIKKLETTLAGHQILVISSATAKICKNHQNFEFNFTRNILYLYTTCEQRLIKTVHTKYRFLLIFYRSCAREISEFSAFNQPNAS